MNWNVDKMACLELHDSDLTRICWQAGSTVALHFTNLNAFIETSVEHFEVWSCNGILDAVDVSRLEVDGALGPGDWVSDGRVLNALDKEIEPRALLISQAIKVIELNFVNGTKVLLRANRALLRELTPVQKLEDWVGPLISK